VDFIYMFYCTLIFDVQHPWNMVCKLCLGPLVPLNDFFSRTTRPILTKLGRTHAWWMGIQIVQIKGLAPFGAK